MSDLTRTATEADIRFLAGILRGADRIEIASATGQTDILGPLMASFERSDVCEVGLSAQNEPMIVYGMGALGKTGVIWAVAGNNLHENQRRFIRHCREPIKRMLLKHPEVTHLTNFTHEQNTLHHRWLQWCGAEFSPSVPYGARGDLFRPFVITRDKLV